MNNASRSSKQLSSEELLSIQFSLSQEIGRELELAPMLRIFLAKANEIMSCNASYVWVRSSSNNKYIRVSFPTNEITLSAAPFIEREFSQKAENNWCSMRSGYVFERKNESIHIFRLGSIGIFALKRREPLASNLVAALFPVIERLAECCALSMRHDSKIKQQKSTLTALQETIDESDFKDSLIRSISTKLSLPLEEILNAKSLLSESDSSIEHERTFFQILSSTIGLVANELKHFVDIQDGLTPPLQEEAFNLRELTDEVVNEFSAAVNIKQLELDLFVEGDLPEMVMGDRSKLHLALRLLVDNAIRNTDNGTVRVTVAGVHQDDEDMSIRFEVSDSGVGMEKQKLNEVMKCASVGKCGETFKLHSTTGLRLAIVQRLVGILSGELTAKSILGIGSVFSFQAKVAEVEHCYNGEFDELAELKEDLVREEKKGLALVADDNSVSRMVAVTLLEREGYDVVVAENGTDAIKVWKESKPDLLLMDVHMPEMDGIHATFYIRDIERTLKTRTPIIALISNMDKKIQDQCLNVGVDYFLSKPFTPKLLSDAISHAQEISSRPQVKIQSL